MANVLYWVVKEHFGAQVLFYMDLIRNDVKKNGHWSVGTFVKFLWAIMGRKILNNDISAKEEDIEL